jgi:radical SAM-linked protein
MKLRLRSSKLGKVRFTSHRDAARMWERAMRRAGLPVATSEGFTPRPKISFGLALPTGGESIAEYVDIDLQPDVNAADIDLDALPISLSEALPIGFDVLVAVERPIGKGSLQESVTSCTWQLWSPYLGADDYQRAEQLLESTELIIERERKGKRSADDVRSMILTLRCGDDPVSRPNTYTNVPGNNIPASALDEMGPVRLIVDLATVGRALRPSELAELAFPNHDARDVRALRTHQWIDDGDGRREVLTLPSLPFAVVASPQGAFA